MIKNNTHNNIYLIGPMGAGKTTIGQLLAIELKKSCYDLDTEIEKYIGKNITSIFSKEGESRFRDYECKQLKQICRFQNIVLSTGGGTMVMTENRHIVSTTGTVIYLQVTADEQRRRIVNQKKVRPLLDHDVGLEKLAGLTKQRHPFYKEIADFSYLTNQWTPAGLVQCIMTDISHLMQSTIPQKK